MRILGSSVVCAPRYQRIFRRTCRYVPRGLYTPRKSCVRAISLCATSFTIIALFFIFIFSSVPFQYSSHISRVAQDFSDWVNEPEAGLRGGGGPKYIIVHMGDSNNTERGKAYLARGAFGDGTLIGGGGGGDSPHPRFRYKSDNLKSVAETDRRFQQNIKRDSLNTGAAGAAKCSGPLCFTSEIQKAGEKDGVGVKISNFVNGVDPAKVKGEDYGASMKVSLAPCEKYPEALEGRIKLATLDNRLLVQPARLSAMYPEVQDGGHWAPTSCRATERTAIIIPYRDRWNHLHTLLPVLIPMLMRQKIDFTIYVVEQDSSTTFNKGLLFNAAYLEAMNIQDYDCFILHDVDMIPLDDRNLYRCNLTGPVHFSAGTNKFNYSVVYDALFGGVVGFTREQFRTINGASNMYFGWGAEDDDLRDRAWNKGFKLLRKPQEYGIYDMIRHRWGGWSDNPERYKVFATRLKRQDVDGLNTAVYNITGVGIFPIYTWISVNFDPNVLIQTVPAHLRQAEVKDEKERKKIATIEHQTIEHLLP